MSRPPLRWLHAMLFLLLTAPAGAGEPRHASRDPEAQVRELYGTAEEQRSAGDFAGALRRLKEAYEVLPTPLLLWPMAELYEKMQQPAAGLDALRRYREQVAPSLMPVGQRLPEVARLEEALSAQVARLRVVGTGPPAVLLLDGREAGTTPLPAPLRLDPGAHHVELRGGERGAGLDIALRPGQEAVLRVGAEPLPAEQARGTSPADERARRIARYGLFAAAGAGVLVGAILWGLDGHQGCDQAPYCARRLATRGAGIGLFSTGVGLFGATALWWALDYRRDRTGGQTATLTLEGRF